MGTNYYHTQNHATPECKCSCGATMVCQANEERVHIGKASAGWVFHFHATDTIRSFEDWKAALREGVIKDQYRSLWTYDDSS